MLQRTLLALADSERVKHLVRSMPVSSAVVARYVAGEGTDQAVAAARRLAETGRWASLDFLGEDTVDQARAEASVAAYVAMLQRLGEEGLAADAEVSVKLSAVGQALPHDGARVALDNARTVCLAARNAGTTVTLDMEDHTCVDATLETLRELRKDFPETGAVLQARLRRTQADCRDLAYEGSRVRLCKGAYSEPASHAYQGRLEVDRAYVRCLKTLLAGPGYPMVASHDPHLIDIAGTLAARHGRDQGTYEFQMLYGIRPDEQRRLVDAGERVRVYVPYGSQWYGYLVRRMAERPQNLAFFLRSLMSKG